MMNRQKRARLQAAGWKVGSAKDFLGLTDEEAALIELRLELARAVRDERARRKLTQEQLGRLLGSSQSRVAKMEAGDPTVSIDLLVRSLFRLGTTRRDLGRRLASRPRRRAA
jgi:predicted XRE-type DNA-binding protein